MLFKLLLLFCLYLPFQLALNPSEGIDLASARVIILVIFFIWLAQGLKNKKINIKGNWISGFILSFLFLSIFSSFFSKNLDWSLRKLLFLFSIFPIYFVAADLIDSREKMIKVLKFLVWGGFLAALLGILQFFSQFYWGLDRTYKFWADYVITPFLGNSFSQAVLQNPSWLVNISGDTYLRSTAIFPDPHMFSFYLGLLIPFSLGLGAIFKKNLYWMMGFFLLLANILTFSRGGYLGLFAAFLATLFLFRSKLGKKHKLALVAATSAVILALLLPGPIASRFFSSFDLKEGSNKGRIETWGKAADVIRENPFFGVGLGNYPLEIKATADYREPIYAHNVYLDIAAETGVPNALVWIGLLFSSLILFLKKSQKDKLFLFGILGVIIFSTHSLVETGIYSPTVLALFLIIISLANVPIENEKVA